VEKSPKMLPKPFFAKIKCITVTVEKGSPKMWVTFVIKKLPKEDNHQMGESSPNLVTLNATSTSFRNAFFSERLH
jgi:hypothetical protein